MDHSPIFCFQLNLTQDLRSYAAEWFVNASDFQLLTVMVTVNNEMAYFVPNEKMSRMILSMYVSYNNQVIYRA